MFNKNARRVLPSVQRVDSDTGSGEDLYNDFISNLSRISASESNAQTIQQQIEAIIGNTKSKYSSVDEAVQDMSERTGLKAFMDARRVIAFVQEPEIFNEIPQMKIFIDNFIADRPGTSVESVVHDLLKLDHVRNNMKDHSDVDDGVKHYINSQIAKSKSDNFDVNKIDMNIGKVDQTTPATSNDPLAICEPNVQ